MNLVCNECETQLEKQSVVLYEEDIWWDTFKCNNCNKIYKTCYNHWRLIEVKE
jgi:hypothetical protein